jgi:hypothetical protein
MKKVSKYSKEMIQELLRTNDKALARGVVAIYKRQTESEQANQTTSVDNGMGFTGADAYILSSFAVQIGRGWTLSPKQRALAVKKMPKYWKQLIEVAEDNDVLKAAKTAYRGAA